MIRKINLRDECFGTCFKISGKIITDNSNNKISLRTIVKEIITELEFLLGESESEYETNLEAQPTEIPEATPEPEQKPFWRPIYKFNNNLIHGLKDKVIRLNNIIYVIVDTEILEDGQIINITIGEFAKHIKETKKMQFRPSVHNIYTDLGCTDLYHDVLKYRKGQIENGE